jgi:hypothetical protein
MASADTTSDMKPSSRQSKSRQPQAQPGDWVAHPLARSESILAVGCDMPTLWSRLSEKGIDPTSVGVYQVPFEQAEFLAGGELEFSDDRD